MGGRYWVAALVFSLAANVWLIHEGLADGLDRAADRICVPLYDETGLECCQ